MAKPVLIYKKDLVKISKKVEKLVKKTITEMGHVQTGMMRKSIVCEAIVDDDGFDLEIKGIHYFKYVDGRFGILDRAFKSRDFKQIKKEIQQLINEGLKRQMKRLKEKNKK